MINSVKIPSGTVAEIRMNSRWSSEGFFGGNLKGFPEELQKNHVELWRNSWRTSKKFLWKLRRICWRCCWIIFGGTLEKLLKQLWLISRMNSGEISGRTPRNFWRNSERIRAAMKEIRKNFRWGFEKTPGKKNFRMLGENYRRNSWVKFHGEISGAKPRINYLKHSLRNS